MLILIEKKTITETTEHPKGILSRMPPELVVHIQMNRKEICHIHLMRKMTCPDKCYYEDWAKNRRKYFKRPEEPHDEWDKKAIDNYIQHCAEYDIAVLKFRNWRRIVHEVNTYPHSIIKLCVLTKLANEIGVNKLMFDGELLISIADKPWIDLRVKTIISDFNRRKLNTVVTEIKKWKDLDVRKAALRVFGIESLRMELIR